ncbi:MAG: hypothetical protein C5B49_06285 [Bdellovibrio sp.]|nr:MAG: hypothetical protein C5B49_06285 [Bdellovibrio sp.]
MIRVREVALLMVLVAHSPAMAAGKENENKGGATKKYEPGDAVKGKEVYKTACLTCHGETGDGLGPAGKYLTPKPRNFVKDKFKEGDSEEAIFKTVTNGLPGSPTMAAFKETLKDEDRRNVAAYVRSLRAK